jgi:hypothetical protein
VPIGKSEPSIGGNMRYIDVRTQTFLNTALTLDATGAEQDWEIEVSNPDRVEEFISYYYSSELSNNYDFATLSLIVASFEEKIQNRLNEYDEEHHVIMNRFNFDERKIYSISERELWGNISNILKSNLKLYNPIVKYWAAIDKEHAFASSLFYRTLLKDKPKYNHYINDIDIIK